VNQAVLAPLHAAAPIEALPAGPLMFTPCALRGVTARSGAVPAIQLGHTGRKAGLQRWWEGHGPLGAADAARCEGPWTVIGPSPLPVDAHYPVPVAPSTGEVEQLVAAWGESARRALEAGYEVLEIHGAHGYLIHYESWPRPYRMWLARRAAIADPLRAAASMRTTPC